MTETPDLARVGLMEHCERCNGNGILPCVDCDTSGPHHHVCAHCIGTGLVYRSAYSAPSAIGLHEEDEEKAALREEARRLREAQARLVGFWSDVEARSSDAHDAYQAEAHRRGDVRHADAYADLSEPTKEWDRVLVRWVLGATKRALSIGNHERGPK